MIKLAFRLIFFAAGVGVGIYYGVHHPVEAVQVSDKEQVLIQQAVADAKTKLLSQFLADAKPSTGGAPLGGSGFMGASGTGPNLSKYQTMLKESQQDLASANAKLGH